MLKCEDCGLPYIEFALDTTIPNSEWDAIDGNGVLCANCIVKRASKLPGIIAARMTFDFVPVKAVEHSVQSDGCPECGAKFYHAPSCSRFAKNKRVTRRR